MSRFKKIFAGFAILFVLFSISGFFILPPVLKSILADKLSRTLHREVAIKDISINPYTLKVFIKGFVLKEPGQPSSFVSFDELYVNANGFSSLFKRAVVLEEVRLTHPYINLSRHKDGTYNFSDLIPIEKTKKGEERPFNFSLNNIQIVDGSIAFDDRPMMSRHAVNNINLSLPFVSNIEHFVETYVEPRFSAVINGHPFEMAGKTKPFLASRETSFGVDIKDLDIPYYLNYLPVKMNGTLTSALLDVKLNVDFIIPEGKSPSLKVFGNLGLKKIALDDKQNNKILRLPALNIVLASVEPLVQKIHLSRIGIYSLEMMLKRNKNGDINLLNLFVEEQKKKPKTRKPPVREKKSALKIRIDDIILESATVTFVDAMPEEPVNVRMTQFDFKMTNLSTEKGTDGNLDLALTVDKGGCISVKGPLGIHPLHAEFAVDIKKLNIRTLQPYFKDKIKINVTRGAVSTDGRFVLVQDSAGKPRMKYAGNLSVSGLATVDNAFSNDLIKWKQLYFDQVDAGFDPLYANIKGISLTDFYARVIIHPDGTLNVQNIFGEKGEGENNRAWEKTAPAGKPMQAAASDERAPKINIKKVTLQGGTIDFTDHFIKPNYSVQMFNVGGSVTGLASEDISRAAVELRGNLGYGSPIEITGKINPLVKDLYADLRLNFKDIELSHATPYSIKHFGYPILKGKLTFDVAYLIENRKLDAKNKIFVDQLTFGNKVESPDAIKAPVTLAASLLKDRKGRINLDIPISGSLDDPQFKVSSIIWKVIVNLITKAVTSPFTLLASLVGGGAGEEMSYIEFDYGSDLVTSAGLQKIQLLAKALSERPNINIEIDGYVDADKDMEGLKQAAFSRKIKSQKLKDLIRKGEPAIPVNEVRIQPQEYEKYLTLAYKAENFPKPRNIVGLAKDLPPQEMEKLMLSNIVLTDSDLRLLAFRRAEGVKKHILKSGEVTPGRIFIVESQSLSPKNRKNGKDSRVEFKLK